MAFNIQITDHSQEALENLEQATGTALEEVGLAAEGYAKRLCPVDTGRLRNSITHTRDKRTAYIGTNVEYGPYVELGTSRQKAQPYLKPAVLDHVSTYKRIFDSHFNS